MIEVKDREIDGDKYAVTQMTARQALKMQAKLIKVFGPCVSEALASAFIKDGKEKCLARAITALSSNLDDKTFESLSVELLQSVRKCGVELTPSIIDFEFAGKLNTLFKVIAFVLEVNYSDFLADGGIISLIMQKSEPETPPYQPESSTTP